MQIKEQIVQVFEENFGEAPQYVVRSPGRVNIIGEHTDYNDGFVFPMAINRAMWIAMRPRTDKMVNVWSADFGQMIEFDLNNLEKGDFQPGEYVKGVAWAMMEAGYVLNGFDGVMGGDVPIGSGLSSSAALELVTARAFSLSSDVEWNPHEMALLGQKAENQWVGMQCGIMDQLISAAGKKDHALFIDCRSLETTAVPLPKGTVIVVMDTATRHEHAGGEYNTRRQQCEDAAQFFGAKALRDVALAQFNEKSEQLEDVVMRRARHVITENERTIQAVEAMRNNDAAKLGQLMNESHDSMRDDFEITNSALDVMSEIAQKQESCFGARMTGGGFGGCAVALVGTEDVEQFVAVVGPEYEKQTGNTPQIYICSAEDGTSFTS
jgi:galactokinase